MSASLARRIEALERSTRVGVVVVDPTGLDEWHRDMWPPWRRLAEAHALDDNGQAGN